MPSLDVAMQSERPSFAKIAAAGLKSGPRTTQAGSTSTSDSRDGVEVAKKSSTGTKAEEYVPVHGQSHASDPAVVTTEAATPDISSEPLIVGATSYSALSTNDSVKPPSMSGKSTASGTTFAMDEKESIQPDDSASMKAAVEDEDITSPVGPTALDSQFADQGARAFQEQLNEISAIEPHEARAVGHEGDISLDPMFGPPIGPSGATFMPITADGALLHEPAPDAKLMEALYNPRDRIWVLKLEQDIIDFVKDSKEPSLILPQCNSFYRMLAHKIGDYYMLGHALDESNSAVRLFKTPASRIARPLTGVVTPSTAASTPPPSTMQMKILRRGVDLTGPAIAYGSNDRSKNTSENGESGNEDDMKKAVTREEREARYEAARLRIMGSARPSEVSETPKEKDDSRSSSVTGKRKKKQRADSNDDFEARSAYSSYVTPPLVSNTSYGQNNFAYASTQPYPAAMSPTYPAGTNYNQQPAQTVQPGYWYQQAPPSIDQSVMWPQSSQQPYDLSRDFERAMSFHQPQSPSYAPAQQQFQAMPYDQQGYGSTPYMWQSTAPPANGHAQQTYSMPLQYSDRGVPNENPTQPYAYGQLPSQALGRPPNALEHPLPGSYKSRHFNPQSSTFVPGHSDAEPFQPYSPQRTLSGHHGHHTGPGTLERQQSSHSQTSSFDSPHRLHTGVNSRMQPPASLTHPLPQPVFASQQAHNAVLPPKPFPPQQSNVDSSRSTQSNTHAAGYNGSTIAKWGAPASLPAKPPPPSTETVEPSRLPTSPQRANTAPRMPVFGSMPPA